MALLFISGLTRSMQFTTIATIAFADIPEERMSGANTLSNVVGPLGMALGVALAAVALRAAALLFPAEGAAISLTQFHVAFVIAGLVALLGVADVVGLDRNAGDALRKPRPAKTPQSPEAVA
jgi:hypothetical protein